MFFKSVCHCGIVLGNMLWLFYAFMQISLHVALPLCHATRVYC
ncbi:hypothetical protein HMPREF3190_00554 [Umbribacter vaginalis]|nr:hypothetical protein HMPREF3190_00554 [Coriobacteriales bacterium DNF00809]